METEVKKVEMSENVAGPSTRSSSCMLCCVNVTRWLVRSNHIGDYTLGRFIGLTCANDCQLF